MDKSNFPVPIANHISYIEETLDEYREMVSLCEDGADNVTPQQVNTALANYSRINLGLIAEYNLAKTEHAHFDRAFTRWYDRKFMEVKTAVMKALGPKSNVKPALKEYEIQLRTENEQVYYEHQERVQLSEFKERYLLRLVNSMARYDNILTAMSNNMRQEMRSLSIESRANYDGKKNKVRTFSRDAGPVTRKPVD